MNEQLAADLAVTGNEVSVGEIEERTNPRTPLEMRADYFINRELSWLAFNERVLEEATTRPTRCSSGCGSCRSRPAISTSSTWSASPASRSWCHAGVGDAATTD